MAQLSKFFGEYKRSRLINYFFGIQKKELTFSASFGNLFIEIRKNKTRNYVTPPFQDKKVVMILFQTVQPPSKVESHVR